MSTEASSGEDSPIVVKAGDPASPDCLRHLGWVQLFERFAASLWMPVARARANEALESLRAGRALPEDCGLAPRATGAQARSHYRHLRALETILAAEASRDQQGALRRALSHLEDLTASLRAASKHESLDVLELAAVGDLLEAERVFAQGAIALDAIDEATRRDFCGAYTPGSAEALEDDPLRLRLSRALEPDPETGLPRISDRASPALAQARSRVASMRRELSTAADRILRRSEFAAALQDAYWTEREGRVVLPAKAGSLGPFKRDGAIIHGASQSGQTMFVEPRELIERNNGLREAQGIVRAERSRILRELSAAVAERTEELGVLQARFVRLAELAARLELSQAIDGVEPALVDVDDDDASFDLPRARHPAMMLAGIDVVPNDLRLELGHALVISGPNAGGKTVALKTFGVCLLLARAGVRLPCAPGSKVVLIDALVTDVGDDQSIQADLSTFSAQIAHVRQAMAAAEEVGRGCVVLLDEIAVGTDPEQGAALAEAILRALVERGASVVVTTHYERLKLLGRIPGHDGNDDGNDDEADDENGESREVLADPRFHNAAVGFDLERLRPTFTLTHGVPGSSSALAVARRLGLDPSVVGAAERTLDDAALRVDALLQAIAQERVALAETRQALERDRVAVQRRSAKLANKEKAVEQGARSRKQRAWEAAADQLRGLERELKQKRKALRRAGVDLAKTPVPTRAEAVKPAAEVLAEHREPTPAPEGRPPAQIEVGMRVELPGLAKIGEVVAMKGSKVTVQLDTIRTTVAKRELRAVVETTAPKAKRQKATPVMQFNQFTREASERQAAKHFGDDAHPVEVGLENACRLVGSRVQDAVEELERFLARALERDLDLVVVQHGHGSGTLRKGIREHLRGLSYVRRFRGGLAREGGEAVTVVWLEG